jgi:hypothetical protein
MTRPASSDVRYGTPDARTSKTHEHRRGRRCDHAGCETVLSSYNSATTCWLHSSPAPKHALAPG